MSPIVDAHQHFWDPTRADYPWMTDELAAIRRPFGPADLRPLLESRGVEATVLVQTRSSLEESRAFLAIAAETDFIAGVVAWVDLTDATVGDTIAELQSRPGGERLVGIRHQVHDEADPQWLGRPDVRRGLRAVAQTGLAYDLLVRSRELAAALDLARALPDLRFVIDHLAKPPIRDGQLDRWATLIRPFDEVSNVTCKLSGMVTEADVTNWRPDDLVPFVQHALDVFGPRRLLFGSDWPVCLLAATYEEVFDAAAYAIGGLSEDERGAIFGGTAIETYRLRVGRRKAQESSVELR